MNPAGSRAPFCQPRWLPNPVARLCVALTVIALLAGTGLRVVWLDRVPPGLHPDEACNGYDAYSILTTGRDHHGAFLPVVFQGFGDFRMALFNYSLVPLVAAFGLKTAVVRLGAAIWGIADMAATTLLAGLMLGLPGAAATALFCALSPWHFPMSRYGIEATAASAVISLAMVCFFSVAPQPQRSHFLRKRHGKDAARRPGAGLRQVLVRECSARIPRVGTRNFHVHRKPASARIGGFCNQV